MKEFLNGSSKHLSATGVRFTRRAGRFGRVHSMKASFATNSGGSTGMPMRRISGSCSARSAHDAPGSTVS